jgi:hypothetical protein
LFIVSVRLLNRSRLGHEYDPSLQTRPMLPRVCGETFRERPRVVLAVTA